MEEGIRRLKWPWIVLGILVVIGIVVTIGVMRFWQTPDTELKALMDEQARKILKAAIRAKGGLTAIANIKDITVKSKSKVSTEQGEVELQITLYIKMPDKLKYIESARGREGIVVVSGDKGWLKREGAIQELPAEVIRSLKEQIQNSDDFIFLNVTKADYQFKYMGTESLNGARVNVIQMIDPAGSETKLYLHTDSHYLHKMVRKGAEGQIETLFSDYRRLGGIMTPFYSEDYIGGRLIGKTQIEEAKFNSGLSDELFKKPE